MTEYFPEIKAPIAYEGPESTNPLAFRYYDKDRVIAGKTMAEHLRFAVAYWHTYKGEGTDVFGAGPYDRPWNHAATPLEIAEKTLDANFEFMTKLGVDYYCFHDRDIAPEGATFAESADNLKHIIDLAEKKQKETGLKLLWGTANLFSNPRYMSGGATNPNANITAYAAAQVKLAMDATKQLDGENYVFWGGREGYETLLNTNLKQEREQLAAFLHMAVGYAKKIGFTGQFLIEPKPCEPTKHQYDRDVATVLGFLREFDLYDYFKMNIEANHATLAGHTFEHELLIASQAGKLGSVDANRGDVMLGWDTDQFPSDIYETTAAMMIIVQQGGLGSGGLNFDAKVRRQSIDQLDLFYAHIGAMDVFARGLIIADKIISDGALEANRIERYSSWQSGVGADILAGRADLASIEAAVRAGSEPSIRSGRQEYLENLINRYI
ncbi:MAG: xylose isomerase [Lentisphaeria bacterium]|nr:xylose isomerase [Lentisphaeria bacterium]